MAHSWIPHLFQTLPFFSMSESEMSGFLQDNFSIKDGTGTEFRMLLSQNQSVLAKFSVVKDDCSLMFNVSFRSDASGKSGSMRVLLDSRGMMEFADVVSDYGQGERYVIKDIVSFFRQRFSPFYGSNTWGRDQFRISYLPDAEDARSDIIDQMGRTLMSMVDHLSIMADVRMNNRYYQSARAIDGSLAARRDADPERFTDEIRAVNRFNQANIEMDSQLEDDWNMIHKYVLACRNYISLFDVRGPVVSTVENCDIMADTIHAAVARRRELDMMSFELKADLTDTELSEVTRHQAENTDRLSRFVAILTGVTTTLAVPQVLSDVVSPTVQLMSAVAGGIVVGLTFFYIYHR